MRDSATVSLEAAGAEDICHLIFAFVSPRSARRTVGFCQQVDAEELDRRIPVETLVTLILRDLLLGREEPPGARVTPLPGSAAEVGDFRRGNHGQNY